MTADRIRLNTPYFSRFVVQRLGLTIIFTKEIGKKVFSKYRLAKAFLRWTQKHEIADLTDVEREQWKKLIEIINKALR